MIKSIKSKKAQQEWYLIGIILAILILLVVGLGFWKGWDYIFGKMGLLPNDLNSAVAICAQYDDSDVLLVSYCQYRQLTIDSKKQWVNCPFIFGQATAVLGSGKEGFDLKTCSVDGTKYCQQLIDAATAAGTGFKSTYVNGASCNKTVTP